MKKSKRRLAAIMFTDIVGYSAMMQKDEIISNRLRNRHREVFTRLTEQYGGKIIQYFGDGTLSIYPSAAAAVECGVALQKELKMEPPVPIRIGIHTGDITYSKEEAYGDGVNVAARIESLSIPGGVFISEKVYDDIKNHSWLRAQPLGAFDLKNIQEDIHVYAVNNPGITVPEYIPKKESTKKPDVRKSKRRRKRKFLAGLLALFFGIFGAHRFYLGQRNLGILYLAITLTAMFIITALENLIGMMAIISFIDAIMFWTMPKESFNSKFNEESVEKQTKTQVEKTEQNAFLKSQVDLYFQKAERYYHDYRYQEAVENLIKAVEIKYDDPEAHFLLARCYSILENPEKAFAHLDVAVAFGLKDINKISKHEDLAYLRIQPEFDDFVKNGYRLLEELPTMPQEEEAKPSSDPDLLEQLNKLQKLYEEGTLTKEEYLKQEKRLTQRGLD
jgi:class 3 adenylate cyclase/TM2 domain-containing membrane protein YozV